MRADGADEATKCAAPDQHGEPGPFRDRNPHHEAARPRQRGPIPTRGPHNSEALPNGQYACLLYTSDAADDLTRVDLGGRRIIKKKKKKQIKSSEQVRLK